MAAFNFDFAKRREKFLGDFKGRRTTQIWVGLVAIFFFLTVVYLGPLGGLENLGLIGKKKVGQASMAISCNATATASWPAYPNCKVSRFLDFPYRVVIYDPASACGVTCPIVDNKATPDASFSITSLKSNYTYTIKVCWPDCTKSTNFILQKNQTADNLGVLTFSWSALKFKVYAYDKQCPLKCPAPGTPTSVSTTTYKFSNLWPSRTYSYAVCWPDCDQNRAEFKGDFTTLPCTATKTSVVTYTAVLTKGDGTLVKTIDNLVDTSYIFPNLEPNTAFNAFIYTPSKSYSQIYWFTGTTSGSGECVISEAEMQDAVETQINKYRQENHLAPFTINSTMVEAARVRSSENYCIGAINHTRPGPDCIIGTADDRGALTVLDDFGLAYYAAGEILGRNNYPDDETVQVVMNDWKNSSAHNAIILDSTTYYFTEMGVGVIKGADGFKYYTVLFRSVPNTGGGSSPSPSPLLSPSPSPSASPQSLACRADFNGDGKITSADILAEQQQVGSNNLKYDLNGDGLVTVDDVYIVQSLLGKTCP